MILKSIIVSLSLVFSANAFAQAQLDFQRQLHIQTLEEQAYSLEEKFHLNFNIIVLDIAQSADLNFVGSVASLKKHYKYFLASSYMRDSVFDGRKSAACIIFINYKNNSSYIAHRLAYKDTLGDKKSIGFANFYLMSHELAHCIAQDQLKFSNNTDEKYADAIAGFFINNSEYASVFNQWKQELARFEGEHNTSVYVNKIFTNNLDIKSLNDLITIIKKTPN